VVPLPNGTTATFNVNQNGVDNKCLEAGASFNHYTACEQLEHNCPGRVDNLRWFDIDDDACMHA
jgi:hypothetical protein